MTKLAYTEENRAPELLAFLYDVLVHNLKKHNISSEIIDEAAHATITELRQNLGGQSTYIPIATEFEIQQIQHDVYEKYLRGVPIKDLAWMYKYSLQHTYNLIRREKNKRKTKNN